MDGILDFIEEYREGKHENSFEQIQTLAAQSGYILLYGANRPYVQAACKDYRVEDLLLPVNLEVYGSIQHAYECGDDINVFVHRNKFFTQTQNTSDTAPCFIDKLKIFSH